MSNHEASSDGGIVRPHAAPVRWTVNSMAWLPESAFVAMLAELDNIAVRRETFAIASGAIEPEALGQPIVVRRHSRGISAALWIRGLPVLVTTTGASASIEVGGQAPSEVDGMVDHLKDALGAKADDPSQVPINFWAVHSSGPRSTQRRISAPAWTEIADNYQAAAAEAITEILGAEAPTAGRLILWHGPPGTGKTYVLRALARAWSPWCSTHVIADPEAFLGAGTSYLLDVLTAQDDRHRDQPDRWKLVVLEDAGELLTEDAHERSGQALSRLLNLTDGILGQGMNTIVLVSTNEPLGSLHPAIRRAGRCWCELEFAPLDAAAANRWLRDNGSPTRVTRPTVIADLYAMSRGDAAPTDAPESFGFAAALA